MQAAQLTEEQQNIRMTGIGASEIAAVCGKNPWMAPIDVWRAKVSGATAPKNIHMERGNLMEAVCLRVFHTMRDFIKDLGHMTVRHDDYPYLLATLDGAIMDGFDYLHVVECKAPRERVDAIPTAYRYQMQQQMMVSRTRTASLVAVHGDFHPEFLKAIFATESGFYAFVDGIIDADQYTILDMEWDDDLAEEIVIKGRDFWFEYVLPQVPPPPDGSESYGAYLAEDEPASDGQIIEADEKLDELCIRLRQATDNKKEAEREESRVQQVILAHAGHHDGCEFSMGKLTWKHQQRKTVSREEFNRLATYLGATPAQAERCISTSDPYRVFRF